MKSVDNNKINNLKEYIKDLGKVAIAFSGGVDSTFLVKVCKDVLKENAVAITIASPYIPKWEIEEAKELTASLGIEHIIIDMPIAEEIKFNPKDRCYKCKKKVFSKIIEKANSLGVVNIIDGTNKDDESDYRPGMVALKELKVKSPLLELGFGKDDIRSHSKELNLPTWSKPAYACLLTRLQIGEEITEEKLDRTEKAEVFISSLGIKGIRVRNHGELARIEVQPKDIENILDKETLEAIALELKALGYKYITLDIEGYKVGSLN
ncbi:ATP-dependent sacrificial sulfur transferase LarE [Clostridium sardiniense]|uniref:ATP-dependent sacrificial sulfur transferase LarE n=1 Tax=Clostridium sardiniense TaxID=29369 RepID=UPI003D335A15